MANRKEKPADGFEVGARIRFKGENGTVTERIYLDERRPVSLAIQLDSGGMGDRWIFKSDEPVEVGDSLPLRRRLLRWLLH